MASLVEQPKAQDKDVAAAPKVMQQESSGPKFAEIKASMLATQMHQTLRITTTDKRKFEGVLKKVTDERIFIDVPMGGGSATLPVRIEDISLVKVKLEAAQ